MYLKVNKLLHPNLSSAKFTILVKQPIKNNKDNTYRPAFELFFVRGPTLELRDWSAAFPYYRI